MPDDHDFLTKERAWQEIHAALRQGPHAARSLADGIAATSPVVNDDDRIRTAGKRIGEAVKAQYGSHAYARAAVAAGRMRDRIAAATDAAEPRYVKATRDFAAAMSAVIDHGISPDFPDPSR